MRSRSGAIIKNTKFLKSAFGRRYLPYIFTRGKKSNFPLTTHIGVLRRTLSIQSQCNFLPINSIAISSYYTLHGKFNNNFPYSDGIKLVCSAFNSNPKKFRKKVRHIRLCESDMVDKCWVKAARLDVKKKYDILIITEFSNKGMKCKGLSTFGLIEDIIGEFNLSVAILDYGSKQKRRKASKNGHHGSFIKEINDIVTRNPSIKLFRSPGKHYVMNQKKLNQLMQSSRVLLCGNTNDASPKIITEAIIRGLPVLLNKNILGGQKYINEENGILYDGSETPKDLYDKYNYFKECLFSAIEKSMLVNYDEDDIINYYYKHWGLKKTSRKLAKYLNKTFNCNFKYAFYPQFRPYFKHRKIRI
jgi:glycosyltransferase involved in cell wall biosynthesis